MFGVPNAKNLVFGTPNTNALITNKLEKRGGLYFWHWKRKVLKF